MEAFGDRNRIRNAHTEMAGDSGIPKNQNAKRVSILLLLRNRAKRTTADGFGSRKGMFQNLGPLYIVSRAVVSGDGAWT